MKRCNSATSDSFAARLSSAALAFGVALAIPGVASAQVAQPAQPADTATADQAAETDETATDPAAVEQPALPPTPVAPPPPPQPDAEFIRKTVRDMKQPFEFHGYMRSGFGINGKGGDQDPFQAPGAWAKYRLGNETDTYGEAILVNNWMNPEDDGAWFKTEVLFTFITKNNSNFDDTVFTVREAFAEAGNVIDALPGTTFWAGQRFYQRHDIHINDFFFLDKSGYGGGFQNMSVGPGKLSVAFLGGSREYADMEPQNTEIGRPTKKNFDIRYNDIPLLGGQLSTWLDLVFHSAAAAEDSTIFGVAGGLIHTKGGIMGGFNKVSVQYGMGSAANFNTFMGPTNTEASNLRITDQLQIQPMPKLSMMAAAVFQKYDNGVDYESTWISAGVRPIYHFTNYLSVAAELGVDVTKENEGDFAPLTKLTIAPQLSPGASFWARPQIRAFATFALWGEDFQGRVGGPAYADSTTGLAFGVQMESWW